MPAKKKQASLKKTKNTTTYKNGGEIPQARFGNQGQFDRLGDIEREENIKRQNAQKIYDTYAGGGDTTYGGHPYIVGGDDDVSTFAEDGTETGKWSTNQKRIASMIGRPNAILSGVTSANMKNGGSVDNIPMLGLNSAYRGDWPKKCCK